MVAAEGEIGKGEGEERELSLPGKAPLVTRSTGCRKADSGTGKVELPDIK